MPSPIRADPPRIPSTPDVRILPKAGVVIIGTAQTASTLATQLGSLNSPPIIAGWIDAGLAPLRSVDGVSRLGELADLPLLTVRFKLQCAVICLPASQKKTLDEALLAAKEIGLDVRVVPPIEDLLTRVEVSVAHRPERVTAYQALPAIDLGELIGRTPHALDRVSVGKALTGKRVLITGAGGSIGSELARVAASFAPEQIILMERAENALFEIDRQIARRHPTVARKAVLHDVVDEESTLRLLSGLRPHVVFHAAAHKHVPLMEDHPGHAITNNLFGTKSIADAAVKVGAERFVMISSDKAVNPTSVMGATKRMAEMYVRGLGGKPVRLAGRDSASGRNPTRLSMVRFGNVLGSACSVLTIWSTQIAEALAGGGGGQSGRSDAPLTITDPRMTRYFMTIPEAATLVVQSMVVGAAGKPSSAPTDHGVGVFVLDMGEPIRILELAGRFIKANGAWPRVDAASAERLMGIEEATRIRHEFPTPPRGLPTVELIFTGARPGEKLHEELAYAAEMLAPTDHPGVRSWAGPGFGEADAASVQSMVTEMASVRYELDRATIINAIRRHVPEMRPL